MKRRKLRERKEIDRSKLIQSILEVRYTDMEEEKLLCKKLLDLSENEDDYYGMAFANVYLVDSHLALGEYSSCDFYLLRASFLCSEYGFDDLMLMLCNYAGLYYQKLNDDQTALTYFMKGKKLANQLHNFDMTGKLNNNIGYSFGRNGECKMAAAYFKLAFDAVEAHLEGKHIISGVTYLSNLAEMCLALGDSETARQSLERCETLAGHDVYSRIRMGSSWLSYYVSISDIESCIKLADRLIYKDFPAVEEPFFICDMAEGLCGNMLDIGDKERAKKFLDIICSVAYDTSLSLQDRIQCLKIRYLKSYGLEMELQQAYQDYYEISKGVTAIEDAARAQSMISKIQINRAVLERKEMLQHMEQLRAASQLDELTGLYNRRYLNKLLRKMIQKENSIFLGFIVIDVDYFKQYNDFYGHFQGDKTLRAVAKILSGNAVDGIYVSRFGGDEFVCLCVNISDAEIEAYTNNVMRDLQKEKIPHEKHKSSDIVTISMGYCNEEITPELEADVLLNLADQALYEAKELKRGSCLRRTL